VRIAWQLYHWLYPKSGWASLPRAGDSPIDNEQTTVVPPNGSSQLLRLACDGVGEDQVAQAGHDSE